MKDYKPPPGSRGRKPSRRQKSPAAKASDSFSPFRRPFPNARPGQGLSFSVRKRFAGWRMGHVLGAVWGLCALWLAAGFVTGGIALWRAPLEKVRLEGHGTLSAATVLEVGGLSAGMEMNQADPYQVARRLAAHPKIATADARRIFPGRLLVNIQERRPDFGVNFADGWSAVLDRENVVLAMAPPGEKARALLAGLPAVRGVTAKAKVGAMLPGPLVTRAREVIGLLKRLGFSELERVRVHGDRPFRLTVEFPGGQLVLLPKDEVEAPLRVYRKIVTGQPELVARMATIDLSGVNAKGEGRIVMSRRHP